MTIQTPPPYVCAICGHYLGTATGPTGSTSYLHSEATNHQPVPVPPTVLRGKAEPLCDFCNQPCPEWLLPVDPFTHHNGDGIERTSHSDWLACGACYVYIRNGHWTDLAESATATANARCGRAPDPSRDAAVAGSLLNLWMDVRSHQTGEARPVNVRHEHGQLYDHG